MFKLLGAPGSGRFAWLKHPVVSNTVFGIVLRGIGDSIQQRIELSSTHDKKKSDAIKNEKQIAAQTTTPGFSWTRMRNVAASGIVLGPFSYYWYSWLDRIMPQKTFKTVTKKILYDQLIGATVFTFLFIVTVGLLDGFSLRESLQLFLDKFVFIYLVDWLVWPPAQLVNFLYVPKEFRVVFVNVLLVLWNVFLSFANYNH